MTSGGVLILALAIGLPAAVAQSGPVILSTTRLVQVHVTVRDSQDRPVTGLRKEDFRIFDERKEQVVASFTEEGVVSAASAAPSAEEGERAGTAPGNGYSAILLDWLNGGIADRLRGDDAARKVLKTFPARQLVAAYVLGMEPPNSPHPLRVISDFTEEFATIADLIEDPGVLPNPEIGEAPGRFDARYGGGGRAASVAEQLYDWRNRILDTVRALTDLADRMARLPGKKSLIWLSNGFPTVISGNVIPGAKPAEDLYLVEVDRVLRRLNRLNITVHTVNTRALATFGRHNYNDTLREFAERTGGRAFFDRNDLDTGVQLALGDMHAGYTLGFIVPEDAAPGVHALQVRTSRPHVKLRFRESYELGN